MSADSEASYAFALRALSRGGTVEEMHRRVLAEYLAEFPDGQPMDLGHYTVTETVTETATVVRRPA